MDFVTRFPCPIGFRAGAGNGIDGLCAMEVVDVMVRNVSSDPVGGVLDNNPYVHILLRRSIIHANDHLQFPDRDAARKERAALLWPILPKVLGSGVVSMPPTSDEFNDRLVLAGLATYDGYHGSNSLNVPVKEDANGAYPIDNERMVGNLRKTVELFWNVCQEVPPLEDFTEEHIGNLIRWADAQSQYTRGCLDYVSNTQPAEETTDVAPSA